jgi:hypothetical protein
MQPIEKRSGRRARRGVRRVAALAAVLIGVGGGMRYGRAVAGAVADPRQVPAGRLDAGGDQPVGRFERDAVSSMPGVMAPRPVPLEVDAVVRDLAAEHAHADAGVSHGDVAPPMPDLAENPLAPPRMDAGDANPDRHGAAPFTRRGGTAREARP